MIALLFIRPAQQADIPLVTNKIPSKQPFFQLSPAYERKKGNFLPCLMHLRSNPFLPIDGSFPAFSCAFEHADRVAIRVGVGDWCFIKIDLFYIFWYKNWSDIHIFAGVFDERFL